MSVMQHATTPGCVMRASLAHGRESGRYTGIPKHLLCAAFLSLVILTIVISPADAQLVRLYGRVIEDASERPINEVQVTVIDDFGQTLGVRRTREDGSFEFKFRRRTDAVRLRARRVGYRETLTPALFLDNNDFMAVEIRLDVEAVLLAPLEVVARSRVRLSPFLSGFERRRASGMGVFFTREDIERSRPAFITDLLTAVPGIRLVSSGRGGRRIITMGRAPFNPECPAQLYVDGLHVNRSGVPIAIDELVSPLDVEGIEVYAGLSTVPAEFLTPTAACGVVVVWTRRDD